MKKGKLKKVLSSLLVTAVAFSAFTSPVSAKPLLRMKRKYKFQKKNNLR